MDPQNSSSDTEPELQLPEQLRTLSSITEEQPEVFASGSQNAENAALSATKFIFDLSLETEASSRPHVNQALAAFVPTEPIQTRSRSSKRKRSPSPSNVPSKLEFEPTPLSSLFVDGMDDDQIWAQLDIRANKMSTLLGTLLEEVSEEMEEGIAEESSEEDDENESLDADGLSLEDVEEDEEMDWDGMQVDDIDEDEDGSDDEEESDEEEDSGGEEDLGEGVTQLRDPSDDEDDDEGPTIFDLMRDQPAGKSKKRKSQKSELDDDFFDLQVFNAETEAAESKAVSRGRLRADDDDDDEEDESDASVDLFAPVGEEETFEEEDMETDGAPLFYNDFFKPPRNRPLPPTKSPKSKSPRRPSKVRFHDEVKVRKIKAKGRSLPVSSMKMFGASEDDDEDEDDFGENLDGLDEGEDDDEEEGDFGFDEEAENEDEDEDEEESREDGEDEDDDLSVDGASTRETIERLKDDLFADDDEVTPQDDLTTHERRQKQLQEQIESLESENVGPKDWVLMGEATSRSRPQNSLLEEDLEFERVMKAVPVITEQSVQALEDRIKARILDGRFDDVVRRRAVDDKPFLPSRLIELSDAKSAKSLSQIYEDEYVQSQSGTATGDDRDGKLQKEHDDITKLWDTICGKLDALSNAHFTPKQPKGTISSIANVSTTTLESALPTSKSVSTLLAPEEVFSAPSDMRARSELTPSEKKALRTKERKNKKKMRDALNTSVDKYSKARGIGGVKKQKQEALKNVVKSGKGVTVVGKKREDVLGKGRK